MSNALEITDLKARFGDLEILNGINLVVPYGEVHALMGPNGSGKSTLTHVLMGNSEYDASGSALVGGVEVMGLPVHERARAGLFEAFQYPTEVPGVSLDDLVAEMADVAVDPSDARMRAADASHLLGMDRFMDRAINTGLSGGEKKRSEMFQLAVASPKAAILDEIDSGLDIDAVREVAAMVETLRSPSLGVLVITHYSRILRYMNPDRIHVMVAGRVVESGGPEVAERLESEGYAAVR
ncbi:MAG: Fe-S cluster assembly ATPase SufC [Actinomycetota bacterium]|nr:Fe-S cluster assembly ATPase SufC [Actinomycetota bacterium]